MTTKSLCCGKIFEFFKPLAGIEKFRNVEEAEADEIFVINVAGYIGESTRGEIEYAEAQGKLIRFLE